MNESPDRLKDRLEAQSLQIERFLDRRQVPAQVAGGQVRSGWIDFDLRGRLSDSVDLLRGWAQDLAGSLDVPEIRLERRPDGLRLAVRRSQRRADDLLGLLAGAEGLPPATVVLGLDGEGQALLLNLADTEMGNLLLAGEARAGKTSLLRAMLLALALSNRQAEVQMGLVDVHPVQPKRGRGAERLLPLSYLPHLMFPLAESLAEAVETLNFMAEEVAFREEEALTRPLLVLAIDDVDRLLTRAGEAARRPLAQILADGPAAGVRVLMAASDPAAQALRPLLRANVPIRLVGRTADAAASRAASGILDSYAEYLQAPGEFLAVTHGAVIPFQPAFADNYDVHHVLRRLYRSEGPVLLAQPLNGSPDPDDEAAADDENRAVFNYDGQEVSLDEQEAAPAAEADEETAVPFDVGGRNGDSGGKRANGSGHFHPGVMLDQDEDLAMVGDDEAAPDGPTADGTAADAENEWVYEDVDDAEWLPADTWPEMDAKLRRRYRRGGS
ncbi:MAG: FtsK/SpoIIIE domain-containing protein [Candidatus Promineifilaceae bacterium]|nr:FtsK/SpoIIIE domain-containing protein [Candidatus Promineifilaceae bacterium]